MVYNLTNFTASRTLIDIAAFNNEITGGWFFILLLFSIYMVSFISMKGFRTEKALLAASFIGFLSGTILSVLNLVNPTVGLITFAFLLITVLLNRE